MLIPKSFTVDDGVYPIFREECDKRSILVSKWLRNIMIEQLTKWDVDIVNINVKK